MLKDLWLRNNLYLTKRNIYDIIPHKVANNRKVDCRLSSDPHVASLYNAAARE